MKGKKNRMKGRRITNERKGKRREKVEELGKLFIGRINRWRRDEVDLGQ